MTALKFLITSLFVLVTMQGYCQTIFDIRRQNLTPTFIDTTNEKTFIYEVTNAILYFKQSDISDFINNSKNTNDYKLFSFNKFADTLKSNTKTIRVKDVLYSYGNVQRDSILKNEIISAEVQELNKEFNFIGGDLIINGHFMIYSKMTYKFVIKRLVAKRQTSLLGQKDLLFFLPNGKVFYDVLIAFGE